ncbi:MAG: tetratricopeptide repeat protein [Leptospirales bacterium]|nr:tetratricopeptide repeat protein [Leptospirales bacterium]
MPASSRSHVRIALCLLLIAAGSSLRAESGELIYAFRNYTRPEPIRMLLVGEIQSKIKAPQRNEKASPFVGYDTRLDQVTVKVRNPRGLKVGQKLYIIDKNPYHERFRNGLIVGEITVQSVLKTAFYGWVVTGTGILLRVREGLFVARTQDSETLAHAFDLKKKGDLYRDRGEQEKAVATYQSALVADRDLSEAHASLGISFLKEMRSREFPSRALSEFEQAWKVRENFHYAYDEVNFYRNYMEALYIAYRVRRLESGKGDKALGYVNRLKEVADAAAMHVPEDPDVLVGLLRFQLTTMEMNRNGASPAQRKLYDESLKAAGQLVDKLEPILNDPKTYLKRMQRQAEGNVATLKFTAGQAEVHRLAVIYYGAMFRDLRNSTRPEDAQVREKCAARIRWHARQFTAHKSATDPEIDRYIRETE